MQAPKLPSFFKSSNAKIFSFKPRYYDTRKERREQLKEEGKSSLTFQHTDRKYSAQKDTRYRIIFLIIILSLLAYILLMN